MTRIIGGILGSLRLKGPAKATRPTSDRVKESLFSILESMDAIEGADVLDLFAGTGALGLEAASRGAKSVVLVEQDPSARRVIEANIQLCRTAPNFRLKAELVRGNARSFLSKANGGFGLVFFDPPYSDTDRHIDELVNVLSQAMATGALLAIEHHTPLRNGPWQQAFVPVTNRQYGDTQLTIFGKLESK